MPRRLPSACRQRLAERDAEILDRVVLIDVEIAVGLDAQVEGAMPRDQLQHVIEETDAGAHLYRPVPSSVSDTRMCVSVGLAIDYRRVAQHLLERGDGAARVGRPAGRDSQAAGAAGLVRSIAHVDAARASAAATLRDTIADADQHEVRRARPGLQPRRSQAATSSRRDASTSATYVRTYSRSASAAGSARTAAALTL